MSPLRRVVLGAVFGALLVLLIHPATRPYLATASLKWGTSKTFLNSPLIPGNFASLPFPDDNLKASLLMDWGAQRIVSKLGFRPGELDKLSDVAMRWSHSDPENGYWLQMQAVFLDAAGNRAAARTAWESATRCTRWDDYQSSRLENIVQQLSQESGDHASWHYSSVYNLRSDYAGTAIQKLARDLSANVPFTDKNGIGIRFATAQNGQLIRQGARSVLLGQIGSNIIEISSYPPEIHVPDDPHKVDTPHRLLIARSQLQDAMVAFGHPDMVEKLKQIYRDNDGWQALTEKEDISSKTSYIEAGSLLAITLPGALLLASVFGLLMWGFGELLRRSPILVKLVEPPIAPAFGVLLAAVLYRATGLTLASIGIAACFGFLAYNPIKGRTNPPSQLGVAFDVAMIILGIVFTVLFAAFIVGVSTPGSQILPNLGVPKEFYGGSTLFLGLCGMALALVMIAAPGWAMSQRIPTTAVVILTFRQFGRGLFWSCLVATILVAPIAMWLDGRLYTRMRQIVENEPVYYYFQT